MSWDKSAHPRPAESYRANGRIPAILPSRHEFPRSVRRAKRRDTLREMMGLNQQGAPWRKYVKPVEETVKRVRKRAVKVLDDAMTGVLDSSDPKPKRASRAIITGNPDKPIKRTRKVSV